MLIQPISDKISQFLSEIRPHQVSRDKILENAFGKNQWEIFFGDVGSEPDLPERIDELMNSECPFNSSKKIFETNHLILIPSTLNGQPMTLNFLLDILQKSGIQLRYLDSKIVEKYGEEQVKESYWILINKEIALKTKFKSFDAQMDMFENDKRGYQLPKIFEVVLSVAFSFKQSATRLFSEETSLFTRCCETVDSDLPAAVGGFLTEGFMVFTDECKSPFYDINLQGVAPVIRF